MSSAPSGPPGPAETERSVAPAGDSLSDRSVGAKLGWALVGLVLFSVFVALGTWQVQRREWKLDLIARVETRVHAPAVAAPGPAGWSGVTAANSEYRHVTVSGTFLNTAETLVQALTDLGSGYWVVTPLRELDGTLVLVNRGFVPSERRERAAHGASEAETPATVTGLLRITEPRGYFLRYNDPAHELWYSRDVRAIARARGLKGRVAPYFIDADAGGTGDPRPVGGLTVVVFRNAHLSYAITWYALALLVVGAAWVVIREGRRHAR